MFTRFFEIIVNFISTYSVQLCLLSISILFSMTASYLFDRMSGHHGFTVIDKSEDKRLIVGIVLANFLAFCFMSALLIPIIISHIPSSGLVSLIILLFVSSIFVHEGSAIIVETQYAVAIYKRRYYVN